MQIKKLAGRSVTCGALSVLCALAASSVANAATTQVTGPNGALIGIGYYASGGGPYEVDSGTTLDGYSGSGISIEGSSPSPVTVTVDSGAEFDNNGQQGAGFNYVTFTDNGGTYADNTGTGLDLRNSNVTLNNSIITGNNDNGLDLLQSNVSIYGGQYGGNGGSDILSDGSNVTVYGDFGSLDGHTFINTSGSATGTFENGGGSQTFSYSLGEGGSIQFVYAAPIVTATPEPTSLVALMIGALGLSGLILRRKSSLSF